MARALVAAPEPTGVAGTMGGTGSVAGGGGVGFGKEMLSHRRRMPKESNGSTSPEDMRISEGQRKFLGNFEIGGPAGVAMGAKKGVDLEL
eukprot:CAMPEP_0114268662 /NCGR_PEP_ID=MMETSP0058-20121206/26107_1 /TAXON_ID=36894 /ORGANISM="Pyramimonas parkeae, CCMP726" /LENGTH=89 /DNA_ID=CAMNT_0001386913 /DNA_START=28 /DNA_END=295 /DNA_ORIENTATION=-